MASSSNLLSLEAYVSSDELADELVFQKTLLLTLDSTAEDCEQTEANIKAEITRIEGQLRALRGSRPILTASGQETAGKHTAAVLGGIPNPGRSNVLGFTSPFAEHGPPSTDPFYSDIKGYDKLDAPDESPNPAARASVINDSNINLSLPSRKRSLGELLGLGQSREDESKSRRTSPSPLSRASASLTTSHIEPYHVDPVSHELDLYKIRQREVEEAAAKVKEDEEYARRLQETYSTNTSLPSGNYSVEPTGRSAYDRMMGRQRQSRPLEPNKYEPPKFESNGYLAPEQGSRPDSRPSNYQAVEIVPNNLMSPNEPDLDSLASNMPGSYPNQDSDSDFEIISSADFVERKREYHRSRSSSSIHEGYGGCQSRTVQGLNTLTNPYQLSRHVSMQASANQNGQSPLFMGQLHYSSTYPNWPLKTEEYGGSTGYYPNAYNRISGGYPDLTSHPMNDPVAQVLNQTNALDYNAMRDRLNQGLAGEIYNYVSDPRKTEKEIQDLLENIRPDTEIPVEDREGTPEGLKYPLYEHQKLALTWLKSMEEGSNKGGILADDMGLGKTISTLALLLSRPSSNNARKTTLIVGPVALIKQWEREIFSKILASYRLSTFVYHSGKKATWPTLRTYDIVLTTYGTLAAEFKKFDALRKRKKEHPGMDDSAYQSSLPFLGRNSKWYRIILDEAQCIKNKNTKAAQAACLLEAETRFCLTGTPMMNGVHELYSLIHFLKIKPYNEHSRFSAEFSCLTKGTGPEYIMKRAMKKLQAVLKAILLRRTKQSKIDGKPILVLPEKTEMASYAIFNEDEQAYYTSLETKTRLQFNKYLKAGTIGKNYSNILVLLLRLRQAACHPHLIMDFEEAPTEATAEEMLTLANTLLPEVISRIVAAEVPFECPVCYDPVSNPSIVVPCGHDTCAQCLVKIATSFDQAIASGEDSSSAKCPTCRGVVDLRKVIDYETFRRAHMSDARSLATNADDIDDEDSDSYSSDSDGGFEDADKNGNIRNFIVRDDYETSSSTDVEDDDLEIGPRASIELGADSTNHNVDDRGMVHQEVKLENKIGDQKKATEWFEGHEEAGVGMSLLGTNDDTDDELPADIFANFQSRSNREGEASQSANRPKPPKSKTVPPSKPKDSLQSKSLPKKKRSSNRSTNKHASLAELKKEASRSAAGRRQYMRYLKKHWVSSSKIDKCMDILRNSDPNVKTIVFSQFTTLLDLVEVPVHRENIGFGRYDGGMSADARNGAIVRFTDDPSCKVLLVSLKAGNAGLNLVAASQVIILDPFWNPFVEMQAVDRAHRIGQQKPVAVHRILVEGTVEDRIIELQNRKRKFVDAALDENASRNVGRLGREELIFLFGNNDGPSRATVARPLGLNFNV